MKSQRQVRAWVAESLVEAAFAAAFMSRISFGPISASPQPLLWLVGGCVWFLLYLAIALPTSLSLLFRKALPEDGVKWRLWVSTLPFLLALMAGTVMLLLSSRLYDWLFRYLSTIQPFPAAAMAIGLLLVWLLKVLAVSPYGAGSSPLPLVLREFPARIAIPAAMLVLGVLQSTVYIFPIGNAFLRFWAIADAVGTGIGYPVTLTEPGPVSAGSPPYVYDLPLFPLMLKAAFFLLGHNSTAAHLPALISSILFPLSLYLLIARATGSRVVAVIFTALASLFPYLRFWVLNLPDPDPLLLTSACLAAYLYLRALDAPRSSTTWIMLGIVSGVLSLARPEGILYAGFFGLGLLLSRPRLKQFSLYLLCLALFLVPMVATWMLNFGFLWPQNYNGTLSLDYPARNLDILKGTDALGFYQRGLGVDPQWAVGLLVLFSASVLLGTLTMLVKERRLLAFAVPGIGNTVTIFFANPYIPNTFHFADFFRHDSFGIPFMVATSAYGFHFAWRHLAKKPRLKVVGYVCMVLLVAAVAREGDILANPTATHRPGSTQVLTTYTYLSAEAILEHPLSLPPMTYYKDGSFTVAKPTLIKWPDDLLAFVKPLDMSFDSRGRPFGYASVVAFLIALVFALVAEKTAVSGGSDDG